MEKQKDIKNIALIGNPNSGKSSIFNQLTGSNQKVGNWTGVTVEKKEGKLKYNEVEYNIIDLPGIYSLTPYSIDEKIARDYLIDQTPDLIINIVDSSNLERNLYLTTQLLELNKPMIVVLNMIDIMEKKGVSVDIDLLSNLLKVPVIKSIATDKKMVFSIVDKVDKIFSDGLSQKEVSLFYGKDIESEIENIIKLISDSCEYPCKRWKAIQYLEGDLKTDDKNIEKQIKNSIDKLNLLYNDSVISVISQRRYGWITGALQETRTLPPIDKVEISKKIDNILLNSFLGYPILLLLFSFMFYSTFNFAELPMGWIESGVDIVKSGVGSLFSDGELKDILTNGIIDGIGAVIIFLPSILILFLFISIFEDTGYMARAAFLVDRIMHRVGLHGKSFVPLIMGFGCNVPAMISTRTIEDHNNRMVTLILNPLVTCNARLPVYILLAGTFFPNNAGLIIAGIYFLSITLILIGAKILTSTIFKTDEAIPFVMELPPYHQPTLRSVLIHMWERSWIFLRKMGTVILVGSIVIWTLSSYPKQPEIEKKYDQKIELTKDKNIKKTLEYEKVELVQKKSFLGKLGIFLQPIFSPLGFDYKDTIAILTGVVAKEVVVSTYGVLYHLGEDSDENSTTLKNAMKNSGKTAGFALAFMIFILIYIPCLATLAALKSETNSLKITIFTSLSYFIIAYFAAMGIYQLSKIIS